MPKLAFTVTNIEKLSCPAEKRRVDFYDLKTRGLVLETRPNGGKTYYARYQDARGKTRQTKLADFRDVTLQQARDLTYQLLNKIALGIDLNAEKALLKTTPTLNEFFYDSYLPYIKGYKRSWELDVRLYQGNYKARLGNKLISEITRQDIHAFHFEQQEMGKAASYSNRLLTLLRYMFNLAIKWEAPGIIRNPTKDIPMFKELTVKERFLKNEEIDILYKAVSQSQNPMLKHIVLMLIYTGARMREVLDSKWSDIDFDNKSWRIPKTKSGKPRDVPLSDAAIYILKTVPRYDKFGFIFPNPASQKPYSSIFEPWKNARERAGLNDLRIHDLRHSFASFLVNNGRSLYEVQKILGHSDIKITQRYAHLEKSTLLDAANTVPFKRSNFADS